MREIFDLRRPGLGIEGGTPNSCMNPSSDFVRGNAFARSDTFAAGCWFFSCLPFFA